MSLEDRVFHSLGEKPYRVMDLVKFHNNSLYVTKILANLLDKGRIELLKFGRISIYYIKGQERQACELLMYKVSGRGGSGNAKRKGFRIKDAIKFINKNFGFEVTSTRPYKVTEKSK